VKAVNVPLQGEKGSNAGYSQGDCPGLHYLNPFGVPGPITDDWQVADPIGGHRGERREETRDGQCKVSMPLQGEKDSNVGYSQGDRPGLHYLNPFGVPGAITDDWQVGDLVGGHRSERREETRGGRGEVSVPLQGEKGSNAVYSQGDCPGLHYLNPFGVPGDVAVVARRITDAVGRHGRLERSATSSRRLLRGKRLLSGTGLVRGEGGGFTLIEMLVVIGVIAILAAMIVGGVSYAGRIKVDKRAEGELNQLMTAIEAYKAKKGFYPPSNPTNETMAPLFYELLGARKIEKDQSYQTLDGASSIPISQLARAYGVSGFVNSTEAAVASAGDPDSATAETFHHNLKPTQTQTIEDNRVYLGIPYDGPEGGGFTRWRYNSSDRNAPVSGMPRRNKDGYDLWIELKVGGKTNIYGNWKS
jgi:prepilin-type N-terminal cleavage/methylation domain-containing protein